MAKLAELRKQAKGLGISAAILRGATTSAELQKAIADHNSGGKPRKKSKAVKKAAVRKPVRKAAAVKKSGRKASTPAKSARATKAKRSSNSSREPKGGRNLLNKVNYSKTDGWNPREDSAPDRIIKALKRFKGDRAKVFTHLKGDIWDFVNKRKADGTKRTKADAEAMLKYRISRTAFDFAIRTGQHEPSDNRVEYGTGGTGQGTFKPAGSKKKTTAKKAVRKAPKTGAKRGRPKGSKNAPKAQKASRGRTKAKARQ